MYIRIVISLPIYFSVFLCVETKIIATAGWLSVTALEAHTVACMCIIWEGVALEIGSFSTVEGAL